MRLSCLGYIHHAFFASAIVSAMFLGMLLQYHITAAERRGIIEGERRAFIQICTGLSLRGLTEIKI